MTKITKKSLKLKKFRNRKTNKLNGGARHSASASASASAMEKRLSTAPHPPSHDPRLASVPLHDPLLEKRNNDCYYAVENLKNLKKSLETDKKDINNKKKKTIVLCKYFNQYMDTLRKHPFYTGIIIETLAPTVPRNSKRSSKHNLSLNTFPNVPLHEPKLSELNTACTDAKKNLEELEKKIEAEKNLLKDGQVNILSLCKLFNDYIAILRAKPEFRGIYIDTFASKVPNNLGS